MTKELTKCQENFHCDISSQSVTPLFKILRMGLEVVLYKQLCDMSMQYEPLSYETNTPICQKLVLSIACSLL